MASERMSRERRPLQLSDVADKLFPHTPIQVETEPFGGVLYWHIYMEGKWHSKIPSEEECVRQVRWLVKTYGDDWFYPSTRVEPQWEGWEKISKSDLLQFCESYYGPNEEEPGASRPARK